MACFSARRVRDLAPMLTRAIAIARSGIPGPVFVECPVDLLYDEKTVRQWFEKAGGGNPLQQWYIRRYLRRQFQAGRWRRRLARSGWHR